MRCSAPPAMLAPAVAPLAAVGRPPLDLAGYAEASVPHLPGTARQWWLNWRRQHRAEWLQRVHHDFAWGLIAVAALRQGDTASAGCWLRGALPARHGPRWIVTDEVVAQVLHARGIAAAHSEEDCT